MSEGSSSIKWSLLLAIGQLCGQNCLFLFQEICNRCVEIFRQLTLFSRIYNILVYAFCQSLCLNVITSRYPHIDVQRIKIHESNRQKFLCLVSTNLHCCLPSSLSFQSLTPVCSALLAVWDNQQSYDRDHHSKNSQLPPQCPGISLSQTPW